METLITEVRNKFVLVCHLVFQHPIFAVFLVVLGGGGWGGTFFFIVPLLEYVNTEPPVFFSFVNIRRRDRRPTKRCVLYNGPAVQFQLPEQKFPTKQHVPFTHPPRNWDKDMPLLREPKKGGGLSN